MCVHHKADASICVYPGKAEFKSAQSALKPPFPETWNRRESLQTQTVPASLGWTWMNRHTSVCSSLTFTVGVQWGVCSAEWCLHCCNHTPKWLRNRDCALLWLKWCIISRLVLDSRKQEQQAKHLSVRGWKLTEAKGGVLGVRQRALPELISPF